MNLTTAPRARATITAAPLLTAGAERQRRRRRRWTAAEKSQHVGRFAESGLSQAEYCSRQGLHPATFSQWCRRVSGGGANAVPVSAERALGFAQVRVRTLERSGNAWANAAGAIWIQLGEQTRIEAAVGTDPAWLAELLQRIAGV